MDRRDPLVAQARRAERRHFLRLVLFHHGQAEADLARLLRVTDQRAKKILCGETDLDVDELALISDAFNVDPGILLDPPYLGGLLGPRSDDLPPRYLPPTRDVALCIELRARVVEAMMTPADVRRETHLRARKAGRRWVA